MKRRLIGILLTALFILTLPACTIGGTTEWTLYYRQSELSYGETKLIGTQTMRFSDDVTPDMVAKKYFEAETEDELCSPFPKQTKLIAHEQEDDVLRLTLSENFGTLSGAELSLALTCITMTFSQFENVEYVEIETENGLLANQESIRLSADAVMLENDGLCAVDVVLNLYYADEKKKSLVPVEFRTTVESVAEQAKMAVEQLAVVPEGELLHTVLPKNTEILDISVEDGLCIVDFNADFYRNRPKSETEELLTIYAIVNTLTEFEEIDEVQILVEGELRTEYTYMDLSCNFVRDESLIQSR